MHTVFVTASGHHEWLITLIRRYGYLALFAIIAAQDLGVPTVVPGTILLIFTGYLASIHALNPVVCGLVATIGAVAGASALFHVARLGGEAFVRRFGWHVHVGRTQHTKLERALWRWGLPMWILFRMVPGFRDVPTIVAGLGGMAYRRFALLTTAAAVVWAYGCILVGMALGRHWGRAIGVVTASGTIAVVAVIVVVCALVVRSQARWTTRANRWVGPAAALWSRNLASHMRISGDIEAASERPRAWRHGLAAHTTVMQRRRAANRQMRAWHLNLADRRRMAGVRGRRVSDADTDSRR
jgi:membrane protein DedA with SNARE-associated domain